MQLMSIYVVYDRLAEESGPCFEAKNDLVARRNFRRILSSGSSPSDYLLLRVGNIDHEKNTIDAEMIPVDVTGTDIVEARDIENEQ